MTQEELIAECTVYDYKEALEEKKPKSWLKSVSAFANTMGGSLFFGIDNDGSVKGLEQFEWAADGRQYTPSKILTLIGEQIETERQQFKEELFVGTKLLSQGKWGETYISLRRLYSKWLSDLFATEPNDEVKTFFGTAFVQQLVGHDEHDEPEEIPISISTVHSAKGMTHCATMYVETAHRNKYESQEKHGDLSLCFCG